MLLTVTRGIKKSSKSYAIGRMEFIIQIQETTIKFAYAFHKEDRTEVLAANTVAKIEMFSRS